MSIVVCEVTDDTYPVHSRGYVFVDTVTERVINTMIAPFEDADDAELFLAEQGGEIRAMDPNALEDAIVAYLKRPRCQECYTRSAHRSDEACSGEACE